jgi:hypothetical protein
MGFLTVTALEAKGNLSLLLHEDAGKGPGILLFKGLKNILGLGMLGHSRENVNPEVATTKRYGFLLPQE